jgi:hypothetical protein
VIQIVFVIIGSLSVVLLAAIATQLAVFLITIGREIKDLRAEMIRLGEAEGRLSQLLEQKLTETAEIAKPSVLTLQDTQQVSLSDFHDALLQLSDVLSRNQSAETTVDDSIARMEKIASQLHGGTEQLSHIFKEFTEQLMRQGAELSAGIWHFSSVQRELTDKLSHSLRAVPPGIASESSIGLGVPAHTGFHPGTELEPAKEVEASYIARNAEPSQAPRSDAKTGDERFRKLKEWVAGRLPEIMSRSLNQWSSADELLPPAPRELSPTSRLLDPGSKLILIGAEGQSIFVAVVLPGGYIGSTFYDWFTIPKGTNVRIERTVAPAVVEAGEAGFIVLERGEVAQD